MYVSRLTRIRYERLRRGMTIKEFADLLGVEPIQARRLDRGDRYRYVPVEALQRLCAEWKLDWDVLFDKEVPRKIAPPAE